MQDQCSGAYTTLTRYQALNRAVAVDCLESLFHRAFHRACVWNALPICLNIIHRSCYFLFLTNPSCRSCQLRYWLSLRFPRYACSKRYSSNDPAGRHRHGGNEEICCKHPARRGVVPKGFRRRPPSTKRSLPTGEDSSRGALLVVLSPSSLPPFANEKMWSHSNSE